MKCYVWKPHSDEGRQDCQDKLQFSIWRFFEQSAFVNIHLLCYWPTIHNLILKICLSFKLSVLTFWRSMSCSMSIQQNCAKWKYFNSNLCWMLSDVSIKGLPSRILVFRVWPWYSTLKIQVLQSCKQKISCRWRNTTSNILFLLGKWYKPMV